MDTQKQLSHVLMDLDNSIAWFVAPKLQKFRKKLNSYPPDLTLEEWEQILEKIQYSMDMIAEGNHINPENYAELPKIKEGCELFGKYFMDLWD